MRLDFGIKYKGVLLDIEDDSHLTVEWYSTVFNESEIFRGSYSYSIDMSWTDKNLATLGFPNFIANRLSRETIDVSVLLFGSTWKNAKMDIEVSYRKISGQLLIDNAVISDVIRDTNLPDMFSFYNGTEKAYEEIDIGTTTEQKKAHMLATATADRNVYPYAFPSMTNFNLFGELNMDGLAWVNTFRWDNYMLSYHLDDRQFYNPSFYLVWLIKTLCNRLGFEALGSFLDHPEVRSWVIYNTGYYSGKEMTREGFKMVTARHFPKITVSNFFKILRNDLKVMIYFDSLTRKAYFEFSENVLQQQDTYSFTGQVVDKSINTKPVADRAFSVQTAIDDGDETYKYLGYTKSVKIGQGEQKKVELSIGSVFMNSGIFTAFVASPMRNPQLAQVANIYEDEYSDLSCYNKKGEISTNDFTFRIFSFRGLQQNDPANPNSRLPYGTSDNKNALGVVQPGWIPTAFGVNGSIAVFCKMFYKFLLYTETVEFNAYVPIQRFFEISPTKLGIIEDVNGTKSRFLFDRISFEPANVGERLFAKIKGFLYHKVFGLVDPLSTSFQLNEQSTPADTIYVGIRFVDRRRVINNGNPNNYTDYAKVQVLFFSDPYTMNPKLVSNLKVNYREERAFSTGDSSTEDKSFITGTNVYQHTGPEIYVETALSGARMRMSVYVNDPDNDEYLIIN